ncbi:MAG: PLD nuclease N-terminal domain-containing protein [Micrococcales bacterium]|nr:PLD nuclease N-terminal domain-containing protein [Micrococcales bacterium]
MLRHLVVLVAVGLVLYAFFDMLRSDAEERGAPRSIWALIILLFPVVGAIVWLLLSRSRRRRRPTSSSGPLGPDDDPDFLRDLDRRTWPPDHGTGPSDPSPT